MYEKYTINKVGIRLSRENMFFWQSLLDNYEKINLITHEHCEHTEVEFKSIILRNVISDIAGSSFFSDINPSSYIFNVVANYFFDFARGFSMMPELNPADFVIYKPAIMDDVEKGDIVNGCDRESGQAIVHKVIHKGKTYLVVKGNPNSSTEWITKETLWNKVIMRIERETKVWEYLVKNPYLKQECINSIKDTLEDKEPEDEKEIKYLENLKKRLEGKDEPIVREDNKKFFRQIGEV